MATSFAIDMARICIPYPTGFIKEDRTYGIKVLGYDTLIYDFYKCVDGKDWDDIKKFKDFYDIVSAAYHIDLTTVPSVRPYVAWVDWCKKNGGVLMHGGKVQQEKLLQEANTLICDNSADCDFLQHIYMNLSRKRFGGYQFDYNKPVPARFAKIHDARVAMLIDKLAFPTKQKLK